MRLLGRLIAFFAACFLLACLDPVPVGLTPPEEEAADAGTVPAEEADGGGLTDGGAQEPQDAGLTDGGELDAGLPPDAGDDAGTGADGGGADAGVPDGGGGFDGGSPTGGTVHLSASLGGFGHTCGVNGLGAVKCWGSNSSGQLGDGTRTQRELPTPVSGLLQNGVAVAAGGDHSCALVADAGVFCWGANGDGQLGDGTNANRSTPVSPGLTGVVEVCAGGSHTCARSAAGAVHCWGRNTHGQLGDGTTTTRRAPVAVVGFQSGGALALACGGAHTCALAAGGQLQCWGDNFDSQLGDGTRSDRPQPTAVVGLGGPAVSVAAGNEHTCAALSDAGVWCWGQNFYGQVSDGGITVDHPVPVPAVAATAVSASRAHSCALTPAGGVRCWGDGSAGQLGDGTNASRSPPTTPQGLSAGVRSVTAGEAHSCAVLLDGGARCWGEGFWGQLGDGTTTSRKVPGEVLGL